MMLTHELKLQRLEFDLKANLRKPIFFDPIAEGLYEEALRDKAEGSSMWQFLWSMPPENPSAHYLVLEDGTILGQHQTLGGA